MQVFIISSGKRLQLDCRDIKWFLQLEFLKKKNEQIELKLQMKIRANGKINHASKIKLFFGEMQC
jgi:hypothetical protein